MNESVGYFSKLRFKLECKIPIKNKWFFSYRISSEGQADIVTLNEADNRGTADEAPIEENNERQLAESVPNNHQVCQ